MVAAEIGNGDYFSAVIACDTLAFQLQWQPLTSVWLKWNSLLLALGGCEEQSGPPCHLSSQCAAATGGGQAEYKVPIR